MNVRNNQRDAINRKQFGVMKNRKQILGEKKIFNKKRKIKNLGVQIRDELKENLLKRGRKKTRITLCLRKIRRSNKNNTNEQKRIKMAEQKAEKQMRNNKMNKN